MTGLQAEGVIEKALFVCGAEGSWPSPEAHVAAALTEQWNDAANVFCLAPGTVVAYKCLGGPWWSLVALGVGGTVGATVGAVGGGEMELSCWNFRWNLGGSQGGGCS